jgi:heterodisulfide reductase subunit B
LDEERRELLDTLLHALKAAEPDAEQLAACGVLLRHLAQAGRRL